MVQYYDTNFKFGIPLDKMDSKLFVNILIDKDLSKNFANL